MEKTKKKTKTYILYKLRKNLTFNKSMKKLVTLPDFEKDKEEYSTKDREKNTDNSENKDKIEILLKLLSPLLAFLLRR